MYTTFQYVLLWIDFKKLESDEQTQRAWVVLRWFSLCCQIRSSPASAS